MAFESDSPLDALWKDYARAFQGWQDLTLASLFHRLEARKR